MPSWVSKPHTSCRVCQAPLGAPYLDLGEQPLANALVPVGERHDRTPRRRKPDPTFPLQVILCEQCGLSQLSVVVNPEILYSGYRFRSGASPIWVKHCEELAKRCTKEFGDFPPKTVLDIAANDGTQMRAFSKRGWITCGIDPSPAPEANAVKAFWNQETADYWKQFHTADLIIAQNVLGHVDDPIGFLKACKTVLAPEGRVVVEVPDVEEMLHRRAFDTIYHEHLSYWNDWAMCEAAVRAGLEVMIRDELETHGGSKRYWLSHAYPDARPDLPCRTLPAVNAFAQRVQENLNATADLLGDTWNGEKKLIGWGAAAKASVYLNAIARQVANILPSAVIDECPEKQGMLMPGVHIPVISPPDDLSDVDVIWCLSWNNAPAIKEKAKARGFKGKFLLTNGSPRLED